MAEPVLGGVADEQAQVQCLVDQDGVTGKVAVFEDAVRQHPVIAHHECDEDRDAEGDGKVDPSCEVSSAPAVHRRSPTTDYECGPSGRSGASARSSVSIAPIAVRAGVPVRSCTRRDSASRCHCSSVTRCNRRAMAPSVIGDVVTAVDARGRGSQVSSANGPRPICSRMVTTGGFVIERRCQFAPSTTSVCPEMKRA